MYHLMLMIITNIPKFFEDLLNECVAEVISFGPHDFNYYSTGYQKARSQEGKTDCLICPQGVLKKR